MVPHQINCEVFLVWVCVLGAADLSSIACVAAGRGARHGKH